MEIRRLKHMVPSPSARQTGLPGSPSPDLVCHIDIGSAVGKMVRKAIVSAAEGKRGSAGRLLEAVRRCAFASCPTEGAVPGAFETMTAGWFTDRPGGSAILGLVFWFDKESGRETEDLAGHPDPLSRI